ncbi:hypothetical protein ABZ642_38775 [Streptomyces sp. NPDC007157]|uniref:hypothetical protein n=1 Tax=Streptomyces sp. NPDC007157 TaxID=3154681 RepID=UPI0033C96468
MRARSAPRQSVHGARRTTDLLRRAAPDAASHLHHRYDSALMYYLCIAGFLLDLACVYAVFAVRRAERAATVEGEPAPVTALRS